MRALAIAILLGAAACNGSVAGDSTDGAEVFARACARCHGDHGVPLEATIAQIGVKNLTTPDFHARATAPMIERQVRNGSENHHMPPFTGALTDAQIAAVAQYVLTLSAP